MKLQTERIVLEALTATDLADIHHLHSQPLVDQYNTLGIPESIEATESLLKAWLESQQAHVRTEYIFCTRLISTRKFIGLMALIIGKPRFKAAEVWYKLEPAFWGQGYAKEALYKLLEFAFIDLSLHRVEAGTAVENLASVRLLESVGFTREGCKRKVLPIRGEWVDNYFYTILEKEFLQQK